MVDIYTKVVLTVIAAALVAMTAQNQMGTQSQMLERTLRYVMCGRSLDAPCYVKSEDGATEMKGRYSLELEAPKTQCGRLSETPCYVEISTRYPLPVSVQSMPIHGLQEVIVKNSIFPLEMKIVK